MSITTTKALCNLCATPVRITKAENLRYHGPRPKPCSYGGRPVATHGTLLCWQCTGDMSGPRQGATTMSEKHESEHKPREWVCSNGTIVTEYGLGAGALAGRLHLESTAGETVLVPAAELLQFLSDYDQERQLAEVTAERDALLAEAAPLRAPERQDLQRAHRLLTVLRSGEDMLEKLDAAEAERDALKQRVDAVEQELGVECERRRKAIAERDREREIADALKRRVEELEAEVRSLKTYDRELLL